MRFVPEVIEILLAVTVTQIAYYIIIFQAASEYEEFRLPQILQKTG